MNHSLALNGTTAKKSKVLVVDDHPIVRRG